MYSVYKRTIFFLAVCALSAAPHALADQISAVAVKVPSGLSRSTLRVCADPNNLPFSDRRGAGFENELAKMLAADLGKPLTYTWWPQRRGFVRNTLNVGRCDLIMGVPAQYVQVRTTKAYYRSSYVFVTRHERGLRIDSFDDPRLRSLKIGVHVVGDDSSNIPPAQALAMRGIIDNVRGYSLYGDYSKPNPPSELIDALAHSQIDVAIAWGPLAGYFARHAAARLDVTPLPAAMSSAALPMAFDIAMGVRLDDVRLQQAVDSFLERRRDDIERVLKGYAVPLLRRPPTVQLAGDRS